MSSTVALKPVDPNDPGIGPTIMGLTWTLTVLAILAVAARFYYRRQYRSFGSADDWIMLAALVLQIVYQACITVLVHWGLGKASTNLTTEELIMTKKWTWISAPFANLVSLCARISIVIMLIRIFETRKWFKWFLIIFTTILGIVDILALLFVWVQVTPIEALWNINVPAKQLLDPGVQQYASLALQLLYTISDLTYVLFPVMFIWKLHMPVARKIGFILLMCLSLITMGAALAKVVVVFMRMNATPIAGSTNFRYFNGLVNLLCGVEQCLVIIMGCIPSLRPMAKLRPNWKLLSDIGESLASLLTTRSRRKGSNGPPSSWAKDVSFDDLEMTPTISEERPVPSIRNSIRNFRKSSNPSMRANGQIRRTDDFTITYNDATRPKQTV
ncbi:hypothetical protein F4779DRAFT_581727 [Xylariaceae sp. FL0662B]|nr:hypothetical protein F4779DRAFT_581727 [Xylariaceae sp. FL0662B]